jgi:hypothetical protein
VSSGATALPGLTVLAMLPIAVGPFRKAGTLAA